MTPTGYGALGLDRLSAWLLEYRNCIEAALGRMGIDVELSPVPRSELAHDVQSMLRAYIQHLLCCHVAAPAPFQPAFGGMMDNSAPAICQDFGGLTDVGLHFIGMDVDEDVEGPDTVDALRWNEAEISAVVHEIRDVLVVLEPLAAELNALRGKVHNGQVAGPPHQEVGPAPSARSDLEHSRP